MTNNRTTRSEPRTDLTSALSPQPAGVFAARMEGETMQNNVGVNYRGGVLSGVTMYSSTEATIVDCRIREIGEPFVSVCVSDGEVSVTAYLPPKLAKELGLGLVALFAEPDHEESPQVDFPAGVDPVAAIERGWAVAAMEGGE